MTRRPRATLFCAAALVLLALLQSGSGALAQSVNRNTGTIVTLTTQGSGTVNSNPQVNATYRGVKCTFNQSAHTGTPSTTFAIQFQDVSSAAFVTYITSGAITADATPTVLTVYPGITATANVSLSDILARNWRVTTTVGGTTPAVTATIDCDLIN